MNYNWDGDIIIHNSAVKKKRYVIGSERPVTTDIREFVSPADDVIIKGILGELSRKKKLPSRKKPGDFDLRARIIWDHVAQKINYTSDAKEQRKGDFWLFPSEVNTLAYGDCEDGSFLLASLLIGSGISPFNVRVVLGELYDRDGKSMGGHCWPMYKNEAGRWCILESTFNRAPYSLPTADRFTDTGDVRYVPHFCFNNYHLWVIRHDANPFANPQSYLRAKSRRGRLANMKDPRFPSGGYFSILTGDHSPGHLELTSDALKKFGFSDDAICIAGDAAQDPDFYEWYNPAAHAQTDCDLETGTTNQNPNAAISAYLQWVCKQKKRFLAAKNDEHALFFLGYLLHGVQDLASHQGVTNAQHSYESYVTHQNDNDCDHSETNRDTARQFSAQILNALATLRPDFFKRMKKFDAGFEPFGAKVGFMEKCSLLGVSDWDLSLPAYLEYKGLAEKYNNVKASNPVNPWNINNVFSQVQSMLAGGC